MADEASPHPPSPTSPKPTGAVFTLDPSGRVASWNAFAEKAFGHRAEEILGTHFSFLFSDKEVAAGRPQRFLERSAAEGARGEDGEFPRGDGTFFRGSLTVTSLWNQWNQSLGFAVEAREVFDADDREFWRKAESALESCEARFRTLFEYAQVGVVLADKQSVYVDANPAICQMLGYSRDELVGMHASDIVARAEVPHIETALVEINGRMDHGREWQFRRKDGSTFVADVIATLMPDGMLLGMIRDVSDSQRAHDYREHLAAIVESSPDAIIGRDLNGVINSWNAGAERIFGYSSAEMIGRSVSILIPEERREEEEVILDVLRHGDRVEYFESTRRSKDGRLIDVSIAASPIRDARGRIVGVSKSIRDISILKEREREIARLSRLYAALGQINQSIVWTRTRDELFQKVCRILVVHGGFRMAWIGWEDPQTKQLVPVAEFGDEEGYLKTVRVFTDDRPEGRGPSGIAFRTGRPYVNNDLFGDPATEPWRLVREEQGMRASAAFPIHMSGEPRGTLNVYAEQREFFHDKEIELLDEAATDLSFALDNQARDEAHRLAENAVRNEKLFSETMIESMPGVLYFYDSSGNFLRWNQNFAVVSGYSSEEISRMHPLDFFAGEDKQRVQERIAEVFDKGESSVEAAFLTKSGQAIPYFFTGRRIVFRDEACLVGVGIDISERRLAEQALRDAELRFHTLFEQTPVGVVVVDPSNALIVECNTQAASQLGYGLREFCQLSIHDIEAKDSREDTRFHIAKIVRDGQDQFETRHQTSTGEIREVYVSARTLELSGRLLIHCVFLDITERKLADARIRASEAHLIEAQRIAKIGSWELDIQTRRLKWSEQIHEIFGVPKSSFAGTYEAFFEFVHPDDRDLLRGALEDALAGRARLNLEHRIVLKDGSEKVVQELADLKRDDVGRGLSLSGTIHDITDRVRIESEREKRHRAEAADRIKSAFLATMSHELRTPLNSIIGFTGILLQGLAGPLTEEQRKQLDMVRASARHLLALVNDVLDISKIEAGQLEVAREPFDLRQSIQKVLAIVGPQAEAKRLELTVELGTDLGIAIGDERRFEQVLLNLLSNAIKFTDHGEVGLRAELIDDFHSPLSTEAQPAIRLRVSDTGMGIKAEDLPDLFQPFRQIDSGLARSHEGTGLGLAICRRLTSLMGGEIGAESEPGKGSTFRVILPLRGALKP